MSEPAAEGVVSAGAELTEEEPAEAELPTDTVPFSAAALGATPVDRTKVHQGSAEEEDDPFAGLEAPKQ